MRIINTLPDFQAELGDRRLVLDMDGVLADFARGALDLHECEHIPTSEVTEYGMHKFCGVDEAEFWERITGDAPRFWETLPCHRGAAELLQRASSRSGSIIATSCGRGGQYTARAIIGKTRWLARFDANDLPLFTGRDKTVLANPGAVLVDDLPANCRAFIGAGGDALLVDRPWNRSCLDLQRVDLDAIFAACL